MRLPWIFTRLRGNSYSSRQHQLYANYKLQDGVTTMANKSHQICLYRYSPLLSPDGIRLLTLRAGKRDTIIECGLTQVSLILTTRYKALSYTWGSDKIQIPIIIDGFLHHVQEKLASARQHLCQEDSDELFRIDAICINQSNVTKRNRQVLRMGMIYQMANSV